MENFNSFSSRLLSLTAVCKALVPLTTPSAKRKAQSAKRKRKRNALQLRWAGMEVNKFYLKNKKS
jgi:hypothetical protein